MSSLFWVVIIFLVIVGAFVLLKDLFGSETETDRSVYQRRKFLMDSNAEFGIFKMLVELYSDKYYIFLQVHYSHLLEVKNIEWREGRRLMSKIDRKSADFVLCDKAQVSPQLVIELDGPTHARERTKTRDNFINDALKGAGLPVVHLTVGPYTKESIQEQIDRALAIG